MVPIQSKAMVFVPPDVGSLPVLSSQTLSHPPITPSTATASIQNQSASDATFEVIWEDAPLC